MDNGYHNTYQEDSSRNRSDNYLMTDWVHTIVPSSEHSANSSTSSVKSKTGGLASLEAKQRAAPADTVKVKKTKALNTHSRPKSETTL